MKKSKIKDMVTISMCTTFIVIASWMTIPFAVNFTMQTFAIFLICSVFDLKKSFAAIVMYLTLGIIGLPVFSGFGAGFGVIAGPTGGYLLGFLIVPFVINLFFAYKKQSYILRIIAMIVSLAICYIFGALWYYIAFGIHSGLTFFQVLGLCVIPFVIPDILKIFFAALISIRLSKINL